MLFFIFLGSQCIDVLLVYQRPNSKHIGIWGGKGSMKVQALGWGAGAEKAGCRVLALKLTQIIFPQVFAIPTNVQ